MQSAEKKIISKIKKCGRGSAFFASDFSAYGKPNLIRVVLFNLVQSAFLVRVTRGIYYYPEIDKKFGLGVLKPSLHTIAESIAKRDKVRIVPTGAYALNRLGLSTQVPMNLVYLTDGSSRKIMFEEKRGILFKHTAPKNLAKYQSEILLLVVLALKEITEAKLTAEQFEKIKRIVLNEPKEKVMTDIKQMPDWIKTLMHKCYE